MTRPEYSPYKALHHLDAVRAKTPVLGRWLLRNKCNYGCPVCINQFFPRFGPDDEWPLDRSLGFINEMADMGVKAVSLAGGEPLGHPNFNAIASQCLDAGMDVGLITNGSLISETDSDLLSAFSWIRISVDCVSREVSRFVHGLRHDYGVPFVWDEIEMHIDKLTSGDCILGASFLIQVENIHEMLPFVKRSKDIGFHNVRFSYVWTPHGVMYTETEIEQIKGALARCRHFENDKFTVFGLAGRMSNKKTQGHTCYVKDLHVSVGPDMGLYICCTMQSSPMGYVGSLADHSLRELWDKRPEVDAHLCPSCWQTGKNDFIEYMLEENPRHHNFV